MSGKHLLRFCVIEHSLKINNVVQSYLYAVSGDSKAVRLFELYELTGPFPDEKYAGFESLVGAENEAWRALAGIWKIDVGSGDPCAGARKHQVQCYRTARSTLALIRQLDRPGVLTLRDAYNRAAYVTLAGLSDEAAVVMVDGQARSVPLLALADYWRGEFATFWQAPPDYAGVIADRSAGRSADWLALQLAAARGDAACAATISTILVIGIFPLLVATIIPAWMAGIVDPDEAMRG